MSRKRRSAADEPFLDIRSSHGGGGGGGRIVDHAHDWHQLISVTAGLMTVTTEVGSWTAPPQWAIWVPATIRHSIRFIGASRFASLYVRPQSARTLPEHCTALTVSPLLAALIGRVTAIGMIDRREPAEQAIATLIATELHEIPIAPFTLPHPISKATRHVADLIAHKETDGNSLVLARTVGLGLRTLERRFVQETGMTIGHWRRHRLMLNGLEALASGASVKSAAAAARYATPSAFVAAFRARFGVTPGCYFTSG